MGEIPKDDPIHNAPTQWQLKEAIKAQMAPASCVLILAGVYSTYSKWINIEIDLAKSGTPIQLLQLYENNHIKGDQSLQKHTLDCDWSSLPRLKLFS